MPASQIVSLRAVDLVLHRHERGRNRFARAEVLKAAPVSCKAAFVNLELLLLRLAQTVRAFDVGEIAAELRVHFADDKIALLHLPHGRHAERMRVGIAVAVPEEQGRLLAAVRYHRLHHGGIDLAFLHAGPSDVPARAQHEIAKRRGLAEHLKLFLAFDGADLLQHVIEADDRCVGQQSRKPLVDVVRQPAVGIERAGEAIHSDFGTFEL